MHIGNALQFKSSIHNIVFVFEKWRYSPMNKIILPAKTVRMASSIDDRYIYCLVRDGVCIVDTAENRVVKKLNRLGNAYLALSHDGRYLGCVRPFGRSMEACIYDIKEDHREVLRKRVPGCCSAIAPCFTFDSRYLLLCNSAKQNQVWRIDLSNGSSDCIYQCDCSTLASLDSNEHGVLLSVCNAKSFFPLGNLVHFESAASTPQIIRFDLEHAENSFTRSLNGALVCKANWLEGSKALLQYEARHWETKLQIVDLNGRQAIIPAEDYNIPYATILGINLSRSKAYAACYATRYDEIRNTMVNQAHAFRTGDGSALFSQERSCLWDVHPLHAHKGLLICSGSIPEIVPILLG